MVSDKCKFEASGVEALVNSLKGMIDAGAMVDRSRNYPEWSLLETWASGIRFNSELQQEFHPKVKEWLSFAKELEQKVKAEKPEEDYEYYTYEGLSFLGKDMRSKLTMMAAQIEEYWLDMLIACECDKQ